MSDPKNAADAASNTAKSNPGATSSEVSSAAPGSSVPREAKGFYSLETASLEGEPVELSQYQGKVALVVNVASRCGLTPQYEGLEKLHEELAGKGFTVLGFPSNDFGAQEPGSPEEIREFCSATYGVTFPMFEKMPVKGAEKSPIYQFLTQGHEEPTWNFTKYLISKDGVVLERFDPRTTPEDPDLRARIEEALASS
ncbi:MAG: glutathione peroxidase [Candidatus Eisenbacteria bacterium]